MAEVAAYAGAHELRYTAVPAGGRSFTVSAAGTRKKPNPLTVHLKSYGLIRNKHIPLDYKAGSRETRLEILAGLMDTDGSYTGKGYDFISKRRQLSEDVAFVARSLGMAAYVASSTKSCNGGAPAEYWRVSISGDVDQIPCRLPHKKARPRLQKKSVLRTGIKIEPIGVGDYFGFDIDGDRLFMLGDFTVTHNTRIFASRIERHQGASCLIAHRKEIVVQISLALAECGIRHDIIADAKHCRAIADLHIKETGRSYWVPGARCVVAAVDTLIKRKGLEPWAATVTLWIVDEGHHVVEDNKWHTAIAMFTHPQCLGLLPTATPKRADGRGLGTPAMGGDGVADVMVEGPPMRWLIEEGYLCDYDVVCADSHLAELLGDVGKSGDWSTAQLKAASEQSPIVGDVAFTYGKLVAGGYAMRGYGPGVRTGIVFASDTDTATLMLGAFRAKGVIAELVTGETDPAVRRNVFKSLETGAVHVVIAIDIVSEGTDIPALQVGTFGRATASLAVYMQQFGRLLRPLPTPAFRAARTREERLAAIAASNKPRALIIDHVGNVLRHGPPDRARQWSLASTSRRNGPSDAIPMRVCLEVECGNPYYRYLTECPYCHASAPPPPGRSSPAMVEGDMSMLDPAVLDALRGMVEEATISVDAYREKLAAAGVPRIGYMGHAKTWDEKLKAREEVVLARARWGGIMHHVHKMSDREIQRLFWHKFGMDVLTAETLGIEESRALASKIALDGGSI